MLDKRKELMKIRFLQKINDVVEGRSKNFLTKTKPGSMPIFAKQTEKREYRKLKRQIFKKLVTKELNDAAESV